MPQTNNTMASESTHEAATIPARWHGWARGLWFVLALNSLLTFGWMIYLTRQFSDNLPMRLLNGLRGLTWTNENYFWFHAALMAIIFLCFVGIGIAIYFLRPYDRMAWFASILLVTFGGEVSYPLAVEFPQMFDAAPVLFRLTYLVNNLFSWGLLAAFLALYPDGRFVPRWSRWVALFGFGFSFGFGIFPAQFGAAEGWLFAFVLGGGFILFSGSLSAQVWRYRRYSTPLQKLQTKWLIYSLALIILLVFIVSIGIYLLFPPETADPALSLLGDLIYFVANLTFVLLPLSIGVAIVRYRLWDIDIIIRRTLIYSILTALLLGVYFGLVVLTQQLLRAVTNAGGEIAIILSTLAIAALFNPLRKRVQDVIDRRFYRRKYDAQQVLTQFAKTARDETDIEKLTNELMRVVDETMQPESVELWLKKGK